MSRPEARAVRASGVSAKGSGAPPSTGSPGLAVGAAPGPHGVGEHRPSPDQPDERGREVGDPTAGADEFGEAVVRRRGALDDLGMPPDRLVGGGQRGQGPRGLLMGPRLDHGDRREVSERPEERDLLLREGMPCPVRGEQDPDELPFGHQRGAADGDQALVLNPEIDRRGVGEAVVVRVVGAPPWREGRGDQPAEPHPDVEP